MYSQPTVSVTIGSTTNELQWNEIDSKIREAEKANGIESTLEWFPTS